MLLRFGHFELNVATRDLTRGGRQIAVPNRVFDLLIFLINNRNRAVSCAELEREVWRVSAVSGSAVPTAIGAARRLLGDSPNHSSFIRTIRGYGYQFVAPVRVAAAPTSIGSDGSTVVGRVSELSRLHDLFTGVLAGSLRVALVSGPAGIGKSTLLETFCSTVGGARTRVLRSRCREWTGAPPFWPWVQIFRALKISHDNESAYEQRDSDIWRLVAGAETHTGSSKSALATDRFRLFEAATSTLSEAAQRQPLAIVIDDLDQADSPSLELLAFLCDAIPRDRVFVLCTAKPLRDPTSSSHALSIALRNAPVSNLRLGELSEEDTATLVSTLCPEAHPSWGHVLFEISGGHPLFLTELIRAYTSAGELQGEEPHSRVRIDHGLRATISRRLDGVSESLRELLEVASTMGREFDAQRAGRVLRKEYADVLALADLAVLDGLLTHGHASGSTFRFAHELVREVLYEGFPAQARSQAHARVAEDLAAIYGPLPGPRSAEIAFHWCACRAPGAGERVVQHALNAAKWSMERLGYSDAVAHARLALRQINESPREVGRTRAEVLTLLGEAELLTGAQSQGRKHLLEALSLAEAAEDLSIQTRVAFAIAPPFTANTVGTVDPVVIGVLDRLRATTPEDDGRLRSQLLARRVIAMAWSHETTLMPTIALESVQQARRSGDPETLAYALCAQHGTLWGPEKARERRDTLDELGAVAGQLPGHRAQLAHFVLDATFCLEIGDILRVDEHIAALRSAADELCLPDFLWQAQLFEATRLLMSGRLSEAGLAAEEFRKTGGMIQIDNVMHCYMAHEVLRRAEEGEREFALETARTLAARYPTVRAWCAASAYLCCRFGEAGWAKTPLHRLARGDLERIPRNETYGATLGFLGEVAARVADSVVADKLHSALLPWRERFQVMGYGVSFHGSYARPLGMLSASSGNWAAAEEDLEFALEQETRVGAIGWAAQSHLGFDQMLRLRDGRGDKARAERHRAEAKRLIQEFT